MIVMHKVLTPALLQLLINDGYEYMLYRCVSNKKRLSGMNIILKPVKYLPDGNKQYSEFDNYADIYKKSGEVTCDSPDDSCMLIDLSDVNFKNGSYRYFN